jgi:hypothetical protein
MEDQDHKTRHGISRPMLLPILCGLLTAQIIATLFVHLSNQSVYDAAIAIEKAGYLPIPAGQVLVSLKRIENAFGGGLFFTLSIGVGLSLAAWAALRVWDLLFKRHPKVIIAYCILWIGLIVFVNIAGGVLFPSLFCIAVPAVTGWVTYKKVVMNPPSKSRVWFLPVVTLVLLTALWATQLNRHLFSTIRDHVLLSNAAGRGVNDFYYRYTLYAAEAFKSIDQKTLRTCRLEGSADHRMARHLKLRLVQHDVMVLPHIANPDVAVVALEDKLQLKSAFGNRIETTVDQFRKNPKSWLHQLSKASDRYARFRKMTFFGLLFGFPILLYILVYGLAQKTLRRFTKADRAVWMTSALCAVIGVLLFLPMLGARPLEITRDDLNAALASDHWPRRVAALRHIHAHNIEMALYPAYQKILASPLVVERYWLARALAKSRVASTHSDLFTLLNDPHPNVICQVFYALGEQGRKGAIESIQKKLMNLNHWYAQWYGYRALRKLGWHQRLSN